MSTITLPSWATHEKDGSDDGEGGAIALGPDFPVAFADEPDTISLVPNAWVNADGSINEFQVVTRVDPAEGKTYYSEVEPNSAADCRALADAYTRVADYLEAHGA